MNMLHFTFGKQDDINEKKMRKQYLVASLIVKSITRYLPAVLANQFIYLST